MINNMHVFAGKKAAIHTLGCKVNIYESDAMRAMLEDAGFSIVPFGEYADVYVINTCSVTNIADRKSRQMISRARKMNPDAAVVAAGCYVQTAADKTGKDVDADIVLGSGRKGELIRSLEAWFLDKGRSSGQKSVHNSHGHEGAPCSSEKRDVNGNKYSSIGNVMAKGSYERLQLPRIEGHTRAYIKVQDGCNMFCTYCIIPFARGRIHSRPADDVIRELKILADSGVKEAVLTGIHLSSYGVDFSGSVEEAYGENGSSGAWQDRSRLIDLVEQASSVPGIERIRLGSLEPTIITPRFAQRLRAAGSVCPHFHLSLQSGSAAVLKRMNRHYTPDDYRKCVDILRNVFDNPAITTDVIVGFPGETEEEFMETERFLEDIGLYETHVFRYSMRAGTRAAYMPDQVSEKVKEERSDRLLAINERSRAAFVSSWNGRQAEVLVESEAHIDSDGFISVPNAGSLRINSRYAVPLPDSGKKMYTGYTREYIRSFVISDRDLTGKIAKGKLTVESLPLLEYT